MGTSTLSDSPKKEARKIDLIPMNEIIANIPGFNCRGNVDPRECMELAVNIKTQGLLSPPIVRPYVDEEKYPGKKYALVAGFRRHMAHVINKATHIEVEIRNLTDSQASIINLSENLERENLNLMQEARGLERLQKTLGMDNKLIANKLQRSLPWVEVRMMALELEPEIQTAIEQKLVGQKYIKDIYSLPTAEERYAAVRQIKTSTIRGEKAKLQIGKKKPRNVYSSKKRDVREIFEMQDHMLEEFGNGSLVRCPNAVRYLVQILGWAAGEASDMEVFTTLRKIAEEEGYHYNIPDDALDSLKN